MSTIAQVFEWHAWAGVVTVAGLLWLVVGLVAGLSTLLRSRIASMTAAVLATIYDSEVRLERSESRVFRALMVFRMLSTPPQRLDLSQMVRMHELPPTQELGRFERESIIRAVGLWVGAIYSRIEDIEVRRSFVRHVAAVSGRAEKEVARRRERSNRKPSATIDKGATGRRSTIGDRSEPSAEETLVDESECE